MPPSHPRYTRLRHREAAETDERGGRNSAFGDATRPFDRGARVVAEAIDGRKRISNDDNYNENGEREWCRSVMGRRISRTLSMARPVAASTPSDGDRGDWFGLPDRMDFGPRSRRHG